MRSSRPTTPLARKSECLQACKVLASDEGMVGIWAAFVAFLAFPTKALLSLNSFLTNGSPLILSYLGLARLHCCSSEADHFISVGSIASPMKHQIAHQEPCVSFCPERMSTPSTERKPCLMSASFIHVLQNVLSNVIFIAGEKDSAERFPFGYYRFWDWSLRLGRRRQAKFLSRRLVPLPVCTSDPLLWPEVHRV
jgi:hypothetical protein